MEGVEGYVVDWCQGVRGGEAVDAVLRRWFGW
jgi:hypothetical protein